MDQPPQPLATSPIVQNGFPQSYTASFPSKAESPLLPKSSVQPGFTTFKLESETDQRRASTSSTIHKQRDIFWRPPTAMILSMVMGIGCSVALHCYYTSLDGTLVGNGDDQQRSLRIGTTLAFFAHVCLIYSIQKVFAQWLWRELKSHIISFQGIDAAFAATRDPLSFTNLEMLTKVRLASILALVSWLIPITTLIAPATLNVNPVLLNTTRPMNISALDISQAGAYEGFSYAVSGTPRGLEKYLGPRTIITRLAVAAATTGEILTLPQPATNASYEQTFFGPYVQCDNSTADVRNQIDGMIELAKQNLDPSLKLVSLDYFAAIPALSNLQDNDSGAQIQVANLSDINGPLYASNQLWIYVARYEASRTFSNPIEPKYLTCKLYNASYTTRFKWQNGRQDVRVVNRTLLHPVAYPANASTTPSSEDAMSYSAVMWALSNQLTGSMGFYRDLNANDNATDETYANRTYSQIDSNLAQTVLLGSSDLNSLFVENHLLGQTGNDSSTFSDQRLLDMAYAGNHSLAVLIPQLSSNITLSLITDPLLAPRQLTNVTLTHPANVYVYHRRNVLLTYSIACTVTILANVLGLYAFRAGGVSHDLSFSSVACTTHGVHFSRGLRAHERLGALPLDPRIARTRLRFYMGENGRWGFGAADDSTEKLLG